MPLRTRVIHFPKAPVTQSAPDQGFVEVRRCHGQAEALVVRSVLESDGIPVVLRSNLAQSVHPFSVGNQGEIVVLAPERYAPRARTLLIRQAK
jgi:hypothetical protein